MVILGSVLGVNVDAVTEVNVAPSLVNGLRTVLVVILGSVLGVKVDAVTEVNVAPSLVSGLRIVLVVIRGSVIGVKVDAAIEVNVAPSLVSGFKTVLVIISGALVEFTAANWTTLDEGFDMVLVTITGVVFAGTDTVCVTVTVFVMFTQLFVGFGIGIALVMKIGEVVEEFDAVAVTIPDELFVGNAMVLVIMTGGLLEGTMTVLVTMSVAPLDMASLGS